MKTLTLLMALLIAVPAYAAEKSLVEFTGPGKFLVEVDAKGNILRAEKVTITKVGGGGPVVPDDPDPVLTERAKLVRDAAAKASADPNKDETAMKLSVLYSEIAKKVGQEIKGQETISFTIKMATDQVIGTNAATVAAWKPTRDAMTVQFTKLAQEGAKDADYAKWLNEVSTGVQASVSLNQAFDLAKILELIKLILELIKNLPSRP
jgi:hypothetical protein